MALRNSMAMAALIFVALMSSVSASSGDDQNDIFPTYRDDLSEKEEGRSVISLTSSTSNTTLNLSGVVLMALGVGAAISTWGYITTFLEKQHTSYGYSKGDTYADYSDSYLTNEYRKLTSSTSNTTLNLSGVVLLALGVASATMFWTHLTALRAKRTFKRSLKDDNAASLMVVLNNIHRRFDEAAVEEINCRQRIICQAAQQTKENPSDKTFGYTISSFFRSLLGEDGSLLGQMEGDKRFKFYFEAWNSGSQQRTIKPNCKAMYPQCTTPFYVTNTLLASEQP